MKQVDPKKLIQAQLDVNLVEFYWGSSARKLEFGQEQGGSYIKNPPDHREWRIEENKRRRKEKRKKCRR